MKRPFRFLFVFLIALAFAAGAGAQTSYAPKWGLSDDSGIRDWLPWGNTAYARGAEAGFGVARYWLYWDMVNTPGPTDFVWNYADAVVNGIVGNGLTPYLNIMWAPEWAVRPSWDPDGNPAYRPWHCMTQQAPFEFTPTSPDCRPSRPDTENFKTFVRAAVARYPQVRYWGFWNEPNYHIFWRSTYNPQDLHDYNYYRQNLLDVVSYILIPGAEAARAVNPNVVIVGPEIADPVALNIILEADATYYQNTGRRFLDVISFHEYPSQYDKDTGTLTDFWGLVDRYNAPGGPLALYRAGRPVWFTEFNSKTATMYDLLEGLDQRTWIERAFYHGYKSIKCSSPPQGTLCNNGFAQGTPDDENLIDLVDVRLPAFYAAQSYMKGRASLFPVQTPATTGNAAPGYEVATQFSASRNGTIKALRFWRAAGETGNNTLRLWTDSGQQLATGTIVNDGTSGWKEVAIPGVVVAAGTRYRVSVNTNSAQAKTNCGIGSGIKNGPLTAHQGFWGQPLGAMPANTSCSNYFVDIVWDRGANLFTGQTPATTGSASPGYEVATQLSSSQNGTVKALRFWRAPGETGTNTLHLWSDTGVKLASAVVPAGGSGWQQVSINGVAITAGTKYRVSVNTNTAQAKTNCGLGTPVTNGPLTAHQGFWGQPMGAMPANASCSNFFVDVLVHW